MLLATDDLVAAPRAFAETILVIKPPKGAAILA
jgi:hypothetical protein